MMSLREVVTHLQTWLSNDTKTSCFPSCSYLKGLYQSAISMNLRQYPKQMPMKKANIYGCTLPSPTLSVSTQLATKCSPGTFWNRCGKVLRSTVDFSINSSLTYPASTNSVGQKSTDSLTSVGFQHAFCYFCVVFPTF